MGNSKQACDVGETFPAVCRHCSLIAACAVSIQQHGRAWNPHVESSMICSLLLVSLAWSDPSASKPAALAAAQVARGDKLAVGCLA